MPKLLAAALVALSASAAFAAQVSPFAPRPKAEQTLVRLLAPSGAFRTGTLQAFEQESGSAVAYDAYGDPARIPAMMKEGPYDVVILPGPEIARAAAQGGLGHTDKADIPNARRVAPQVAAKLAAYDPGGYSIAWGWSATGLLYDAAKAPPLLGGLPNSWGAALTSNLAGKLAPCGVALPELARRIVRRRSPLHGRRSRPAARTPDRRRCRSHHRRAKDRPHSGFARSRLGHSRGRRLPDARRRAAGGNRHAPQPRRRPPRRHPLCIPARGRPDPHRRAGGAARRAPSP